MIEFNHLKETDPQVYDLVISEYNRQNAGLELIASENRPSEAVLEAQASYHTLKYAEGYPGKRYYGGCRIIDKTEQLAIDRACKLFNCNYANVQPHSGAQANMAVQFALLKPGDTILGMSLNSGGHLTHGAKPTFSGKNYNAIQYEVDKNTYEIDYQKLEQMVWTHKPKMLIAGASAYPREIDFSKIRSFLEVYNKTAEEKCYFMVDMAHIAGLVAAGLHQSPISYADVVTTTTHKTLRGPRGGLILTNYEDIITKVNKAVFPGIQGGPLENIIAAKAVCFGEALQPEFKEYIRQVVINNKVLANELKNKGVDLLTNGTDNHLILLDLRKRNITGQELQDRLEEIDIISNKNAIPFDTQNKMTTSGLRLGTAAVTSRGLKEEQMKEIAEIIYKCLGTFEEFEKEKSYLKYRVSMICLEFPLYPENG